MVVYCNLAYYQNRTKHPQPNITLMYKFNPSIIIFIHRTTTTEVRDVLVTTNCTQHQISSNRQQIHSFQVSCRKVARTWAWCLTGCGPRGPERPSTDGIGPGSGQGRPGAGHGPGGGLGGLGSGGPVMWYWVRFEILQAHQCVQGSARQ